ncbi:MAG: TonB-dependent receptor [Saprospiraceae bacterium]
MKIIVLTSIFTCIAFLLSGQNATVSEDTLLSFSLEEVVVSGSRVSEKLLASPVSISKLDAHQIRRAAAPSFFGALGNMKGVQMLVPSMGFRVLNTRGFSNTTNVRFVQLVDGIDNQAPHIGAPVADALCPSDLDIDQVEIVQGVSSALYGMNATNGLANFQTISPFEMEGLSFKQQIGINHLKGQNGVRAKGFQETALRWAKAIHTKLAFKTNISFTKGYDWIADNRTDLNPLANQTTNLTGANNPAFDEVNGYGNEPSNRRILSAGGKTYVVTRTGYREFEVADYPFQHLKGDASLVFRPNEKTTLSYGYRAAYLNNIYQRANRFRMEDYNLQQNTLQLKHPFLQIRAYVTSENSGNSYNLRSMAENIDRNFKSDDIWFSDYTKAFDNAIKTNTDIAQAHKTARYIADTGRPQPGTTEFRHKRDSLGQINNWDVGAALKVRAYLLHSEGILDLGQILKTRYEIQVGMDLRQHLIVPDGNYFINPNNSTRNLTFGKFGIFLQASKGFFQNTLRLSAALRTDKYDYFEAKLNPRLTAVYALHESRFLRFSYQKGYRFPSIFEGFSNINSGGVKRVGGLRIMSNGIFENSWLKNSIDAFQAAVIRDVNTEGLSQEAAIEKNKHLLRRNTYTYLKPEQIHTFESGFRGLAGQKLFFDLDFYFNRYADFIAQVEASIPNTMEETQIPASLFTRSKQSRFRLWTNSQTTVYNYGGGLELRYPISDLYSVSGQLSYTKLKRTDQNDGLEDGFNTPNWMANCAVTGDGIFQTLGFNVTARYQSGFYWLSFLVSGDVPAIFTMDCQLNYTFIKANLNLKLGATNLFNRPFYTYLGGPQIAGFYYTTLTAHF